MTRLEAAWEAIVNSVFPLRCGLCGLIAESGVCETCLQEFVPLETPVSRHAPHEPIQIAIALYKYEGRAAQAVQRLKYERVTSLADPLASMLYSGYQVLDLPPFDLVIPVPIHWRRLCWRGFNQAELLAQPLLSTNQPKALLRIKSTRPQVGLSAADRLTNLSGAFRADQSVQGKTVLMVDDVYTSGSTARACGAALRAAGATYVGILTFARGNDLAAA